MHEFLLQKENKVINIRFSKESELLKTEKSPKGSREINTPGLSAHWDAMLM